MATLVLCAPPPDDPESYVQGWQSLYAHIDIGSNHIAFVANSIRLTLHASTSRRMSTLKSKANVLEHHCLHGLAARVSNVEHTAAGTPLLPKQARQGHAKGHLGTSSTADD